MKNELFIWFYRGYLPVKGIPLNDDIIMFDSFDNNKNKFYNKSEWAVLDYKPMPFPPNDDKYKFPQEQYLVIKKKMKEILFDYIDYRSNVKIFSEELYNILLNNGLNTGYEKSETFIVDKTGNKLTDKKYIALRYGLFDDNLFNFNEKTKQRTKVNGSTNYTFPDLVLKDGAIEKSVFVINKFAYRNCIIFKGSILNELLKFYETIYKIKEFPHIYENQYEEEIMPKNNKYKIIK
jgi:hypothetical protein